MELARDRSRVGVRREEVKDREAITRQEASPACGGTWLGNRRGAGSRSV